jgi:hypothetical protein
MSLSTLSEPNTRQKMFSGTYVSHSVFYTDSIRVILSIIQLKLSQRWNYILASHLHKNIRLVNYKYTMNPSNKMFIISSFLTLSGYIFSKLIFLKYHYTFSIYKAINFTIEESLYLSNRIFYKYLLLTTLAC